MLILARIGKSQMKKKSESKDNSKQKVPYEIAKLKS